MLSTREELLTSTVTVGIAARNEEISIGSILRQVLDQTEGLERQILVVSDGSTDHTAEVAAEFPEVELVVHASPQGKTAAINAIFRLARNEIVVMIDGDVTLGPGAVPELLRALRNPGTYAVGARVETIQRQDCLFSRIAEAKSAALNRCRHDQTQAGHRVYLTGALYAMRRKLIDEFELPPQTVNDDAHLSVLLHRRGYRFEFCPSALCFVGYPRNLVDLIRQNLRTRIGRRQFPEFPEHLATEPLTRSYLLRVARQRGDLRMAVMLYLGLDVALRPVAAVAARTSWGRSFHRWTPVASTKSRPDVAT